ncbi:condensin-2 complex subunit H2, partial [Tanacetum coccineum]
EMVFVDLPETGGSVTKASGFGAVESDSLLASCTETEKQSALAARVLTWKQRIEKNLDEQDARPPFDIYEYGQRTLDKLSQDVDAGNAMTFTDVVRGQEKHEMANWAGEAGLSQNGFVCRPQIGTSSEGIMSRLHGQVCASIRLKRIQGLELASDILSPIVFLTLTQSMGSLKSDLQLLEDLTNRVSLSLQNIQQAQRDAESDLTFDFGPASERVTEQHIYFLVESLVRFLIDKLRINCYSCI